MPVITVFALSAVFFIRHVKPGSFFNPAYNLSPSCSVLLEAEPKLLPDQEVCLVNQNEERGVSGFVLNQYVP